MASGQAALNETCNSAYRRRAAQVTMDNQPDLTPDRTAADVMAFQLWIRFAEEFWQGRQPNSRPRGRRLVLQIVGAKYDLARSRKAHQPSLLRRFVHAGIVGDERESMRWRRLQIVRRAVQGKLEIADLARNQSRLGRTRQAKRQIGFATVEQIGRAHV